MSNTGSVGARHREAQSFGLYTADGRRKYLNHAERMRALTVMNELPRERALFALTLAWTGGRISEVLALTPLSFQIETGIVAIRTLKRRRFVMREIPLSPETMAALVAGFDLVSLQRDPIRGHERLWSFSRTTAWRIIKRVMDQSGVSGCHACPKAFRHAFGIGTLHASVPINLTQRWLGHARLTTTSIYADACGPEEIAFASRFWKPLSTPVVHAAPKL